MDASFFYYFKAASATKQGIDGIFGCTEFE